MNQDIHRAALRAAAKLALGVTFVTGCSSSDDSSRSETSDLNAAAADSGASDAAAVSCKPIFDSIVTCHSWDGLRDYPRTRPTSVPVSGQALKDVSDCCRAALQHFGNLPEPRWECCNVLLFNGDDEPGGAGLPMGCTPWGPPVPPAMRARAVA
jgi:hypothetical protein